MNSKKSIFRLMAAIVFVCVLAGTLAVEAANEFTLLNENCKDVVNDGIPFTTATSISGSAVDDWREIQVTVTDPNGISYSLSTGDVVKELTLYAASNNTAYQCQQNTGDSAFSCNSFPAGGTIARISIRFVPNYSGTLPQVTVITGTYTINVLNVNTGNTIFTGTAKVDAASAACAWNQVPGAFTPTSGSGFIYQLCSTAPEVQTLEFLENSANPFTIVSFPLGETIDPKRFVLYGNSVINEYDYALVLGFKDKNNYDLTITYQYFKGTDPKSSSNPVTYSSNWPGVTLPVRLVSGYLMVNRGTTPVNLLPQKTNFTFTFYYRNNDPTLGYENSMFHFMRTMTVEFSPYCTGNQKYKMSPTAYDPCIAAKQTFTVSFIDTDGYGYAIESDSTYHPNDVSVSIPPGTYDTTNGRHFYFDTKKCTNAECTTLAGTDAYVYRVYVSDGDMDKIIHLPEWINSIVLFLLKYAFAPIFWVVTYFRLKEKEI